MTLHQRSALAAALCPTHVQDCLRHMPRSCHMSASLARATAVLHGTSGTLLARSSSHAAIDQPHVFLIIGQWREMQLYLYYLRCGNVRAEPTSSRTTLHRQ